VIEPGDPPDDQPATAVQGGVDGRPVGRRDRTPTGTAGDFLRRANSTG